MIDLVGILGFTGSFEMSLDVKGRVTIPALFTKVLASRHAAEEGNVVISVGPERCIEVHPVAEFQVRMAQIMKLPDLDRNSRALKRSIQENTYPAQLDGNNRVRLPQQLVGKCGMEKELVAVGRGDFFELWDRRTYEAISARNFENMDEAAQQALSLED